MHEQEPVRTLAGRFSQGSLGLELHAPCPETGAVRTHQPDRSDRRAGSAACPRCDSVEALAVHLMEQPGLPAVVPVSVAQE